MVRVAEGPGGREGLDGHAGAGMHSQSGSQANAQQSREKQVGGPPQRRRRRGGGGGDEEPRSLGYASAFGGGGEGAFEVL